ncbi:MAG TPA: hypothetical protein VH142_19540 [Polyangiaceae bacterium]|nr:hypothetical protein [Polyangiaceae bacterium]
MLFAFASRTGMPIALLALLLSEVREPHWPEAATQRRAPCATYLSQDIRFVEQQPVCVGANGWSAGDLGRSVLYRVRRNGNVLSVGYFFYWSTERPWGNNVYSYTLLPALLTDAVYSHLLYVLPGIKDVLYGSGDVEGVEVNFEDAGDGTFSVKDGLADDGHHDPVSLSASELFDDRGRLVFVTDVWSHQLGAHGGAAFARSRAHDLVCYGPLTIRPMTPETAQSFRLGDERTPRRAGPAWHAVQPLDDENVSIQTDKR